MGLFVLYLQSISDVELTKLSGLLEKLDDKPGISIMALLEIVKFETIVIA